MIGHLSVQRYFYGRLGHTDSRQGVIDDKCGRVECIAEV